MCCLKFEVHWFLLLLFYVGCESDRERERGVLQVQHPSEVMVVVVGLLFFLTKGGSLGGHSEE